MKGLLSYNCQNMYKVMSSSHGLSILTVKCFTTLPRYRAYMYYQHFTVMAMEKEYDNTEVHLSQIMQVRCTIHKYQMFYLIYVNTFFHH